MFPRSVHHRHTLFRLQRAKNPLEFLRILYHQETERSLLCHSPMGHDFDLGQPGSDDGQLVRELFYLLRCQFNLPPRTL